MPKKGRDVLGKLLNPAATLCGLRVRADMRWLMLRNRLGSSAVSNPAGGPVVSLTTYGKRAQAVYLAIESIARGSVLPSRLILWIDDEALYANLPTPLLRLRRRGLEIRLCKNYGPHKKYYPYVQSQNSFRAPFVTADDDVIYPYTWLAGLLAAHDEFPRCVNCYRARVMMFIGRTIAPYRDWPLCDSTAPSYRTVATGVSGVIYPSPLLVELKSAGTAFEARCPRADDLWLHVQAVRSGFHIRQIQTEPIHFPMIPGSQDSSLYAENCAHDDGNDRQVAVTYEPPDLEVFQRESG